MLKGILLHYLRLFDIFLCRLLGLEKEEVNPCFFYQKKGNLFISSCSSFKRHLTHESWDTFSLTHWNRLKRDDQLKIGVSMGKSLAKHLVISFEGISLEQE